MGLKIALPADAEEIVRREIEAGRFETAEEVVQAALMLLEETKRIEAEKLAWLREAWDAGIASGPSEPLDVESLKQEARRRRASA